MASLIQYVIVNKEIITKLGWPLGAVIAQCCHATTAVGHQFKDDADVKTYFGDIDNMHKVVLEIATEDELRKLSEDLVTNDIKHKLWIEQPENIATCIALKPYEKDSVKKITRKYKMLK
ncbi:putative peptidyl-tRNA hydrolase PTRHD1 [Sitodiplosis mosellana]|uniref:putative peptidyl-tRNA hydrolase PTRHD1 n=1 Tax=Sitodiplosis mosellana TaxID=263140 RepID=UPI0024441C8F|nr:putative peptidyl-tRNA hydrolase PTRHD1 [Sitodiplosis mosellana]